MNVNTGKTRRATYEELSSRLANGFNKKHTEIIQSKINKTLTMHYYALFCVAVQTTWLLTGMQSEAHRVNRALFHSVPFNILHIQKSFKYLQYPDFDVVHIWCHVARTYWGRTFLRNSVINFVLASCKLCYCEENKIRQDNYYVSS